MRMLVFRLAVWILSAIVGVAVFSWLQVPLALFDDNANLGNRITFFTIAGVFIGTITGLIVALGNVLVPLHPALRSIGWFMGTLSGWAVAGALYGLLYWLTTEPIDISGTFNLLGKDISIDEAIRWPIMGAGIGLGIGLAQWFALRQVMARSQLWILSNILGWSVGPTVYWLIFQTSLTSPTSGFPWAIILSLLSVGIIAGSTTGMTMTYLIARPLND